MSNHPNRSRRPAADATPAAIRAARKAAGLTQTQAGALCHRSLRAWQDAEAGTRNLDAAAWELFLLRVGQHPTHALKARQQAACRGGGALPGYASPADICATRVRCGAGAVGDG